jgi:hypothetical protein
MVFPLTTSHSASSRLLATPCTSKSNTSRSWSVSSGGASSKAGTAGRIVQILPQLSIDWLGSLILAQERLRATHHVLIGQTERIRVRLEFELAIGIVGHRSSSNHPG